MIIKCKPYIVCLFFLLLLILILCCSTNVSVAFAEVNSEEVIQSCQEMTDSDCPNGVSWKSYVKEFIGKTNIEYSMETPVPQGMLFQNGCIYLGTPNTDYIFASAFGDDNIVNIIPKEMFFSESDHYYIGKEYGFYIKNESYAKYNLSTVLLIDVEMLQNNDYVFDLKVQPTCQMTFYAIKPTTAGEVEVLFQKVAGSFSSDEKGKILLNQTNGYVVIPAISYRVVYDTQTRISTKTKKYQISNRFNVSDISFSANIYNNNSCNFFDDDYNIDNDYGYFFIGNNYYYSATEIVNKNEKQEGIHQIGETLFSAAMGQFPLIGNILTISDALFSIADGFFMMENSVRYNETNESYYFNEVNFNNTRETQKQTYNGLLKTSVIAINSYGKLLFELNDYARGVFNITHTDRASSVREYCLIQFDIGLKVIDNYKNTTTLFTSDWLNYDIGQPNINETVLNQETEYYILPQKDQIFVFNVPYNGKYVFSIQSYNMRVLLDEVPLESNNRTYEIDLIANKNYTIRLQNYGFVINRGIFIIDAKTISNCEQIPIPSNEKSLVRYSPSRSDMYTVDVGSNGEICDVLLFVNGSFSRLQMLDDYVIGRQIDLFLKGEENYYFLVSNTSQDDSIVKFDIMSVENSIAVGEKCEISLSEHDNYKYIRLLTSETEILDYYIMCDSTINPEEVYSFRLIDADGNFCAIDSFSYGYMKAFSLRPNSVYYFGVYSSHAKLSSVNVTTQSPVYKWKIYRNDKLIRSDSQKSIILERGENYKFELWINDLVKVRELQKISDSINGQGIKDFNAYFGSINISTDRQDNSSFTLVGYMDDDKSAWYAHELNVTVVLSLSELSISIEDKDQLILRITSSRDINITEINIELSGKNEKGINFSGTLSSIGESCDLLDVLASEKAINDSIIRLKNVKINTNYGVSRYVSLDKSFIINCMYSRSETTGKIFKITKYYITNALHLYNIRNFNSSVYMDNDINIGNTYREWEPIDLWEYTFWGESHNIYGLKITHQQSGNIGFIRRNLGAVNNVTIYGNITLSANNSDLWSNVGGIVGVNDCIPAASEEDTENKGGVNFSCFIGEISVPRPYSIVGGIVGVNYGQIWGCITGDSNQKTTITGYGDIGGISGKNTNFIYTCVVTNLDIKSKSTRQGGTIGGVVGHCTKGEMQLIRVNNTKIESIGYLGIGVMPKMGIVVGYLIEGVLKNVEASNCSYDISALFVGDKIYCFRDDKAFWGKWENATIDGITGLYGP